MADGNDGASSAAGSITILLSLTSSPSAPRIPLAICPPLSAADLRARASDAANVPLGAMKLIFRGRVIADKGGAGKDVVVDYKLEDGSVVHVMGKPVAAAAMATATAAAGVPSPAAPAGASVSLLPPGSAAAPSAAASSSPLASALAALRSSNPPDAHRTALATAEKLLSNIVSKSDEEKYRSVKKSNPAFRRRLGGCPGGEALLAAAGFESEADKWVLTPSADAWPKLVEAREGVRRALAEIDGVNAGAGATANSFANPPGAATGGFPGMSTVPGGAGMDGAGMEGAMQSMLSNPEQLASMMSNPMVQQMMRSDPRFANNPMIQQSMEALASNPDMVRQFSSMMGDPAARENITRMMQAQRQQGAGGAGAGAANGAGFGAGGPDEMRRQMEEFARASQRHGGTGGTMDLGAALRGANAAVGLDGGGAAPGAGGGGATGGTAPAGGGGNDADMTEEDMIAEAIRRSLGES